MTPLPNRIAVYLTAALALIGGLAPLVGNLDWESTAGVLAALAAILAVAIKWLDGWSKYERGIGDALLPGDDLDELDDYDELDDEFDEATAEPVPPAVAELAHTPDPGTTLAPPGTLGSPATGSPPPRDTRP